MSISSMESILKRDGITIEYADADEQIVSFKDGTFAVNKEFKVGGDTNLSTNLTVTGPGHFKGTLHVNSSINISKDGLTIKEVTGGDSLIVNGSSLFNNDAHLYNTLITDKKTQLNSTLDVGRSTTMNSTLTVANAATLQNKTTITKATGNALTVDGNSKLFGATTISSFVNVTNFTKLNARLEVNGPSEMNDAVVITKSGTTALTVTGTANLSGVVTLGSSLSVQGAAHLNSSMIVPNETNINNSLTITNAIGNALHVSGQTNLVGAASFGSSILIPNVTTLQSTLSVGKKVVLNDALDVHEAAYLRSSITVEGLFNPNAGMVMVGENSGLLIRGSTNITGAVVFQSTMEVGGDTYLSSNVSVKGYSHLNSSVVISLDPSLGNALVVNGSTKLNGATDFQSTLGVSSFVNMFSTVNVLGQSNLHHAIDVSREVLMKSSLQVEKMAKLKEGMIVSRVSAGDALSVVGSSNVSSSMNFGSSLNVIGAVQFNSSFQADGPSVLNSSLQITHLSDGNALSVTGSTLINDVVKMQSSLTVFGATKLNSSLSTIKETTLNNGLVVNGNTLGNTLSVYGSSKFNASTVIGSNLNVFHGTILSTTLNVTGKATIDDDLDVVGAAHLLSTFRVDNIVTLNNMVTMSSLHVSTGTTHFMSSVDVVTSLTANSTVYMSTVTMFNETGSTLRVAGKSNITNDVTIIGSLTVDGDTTAIQGESIQVKDNAILIGDNHNSDEIAAGFLIKYASTNIANNTSTILFAGMKRVPISGEFHFFKNATVELPVSSILTVAPHITASVISTQNSYVSSASTVQGSTLTVWGNVINYSSTLSTNYSNVYSTTQSNYISTTQAVLNSTNISYNNAIQYQFTTSTNYINVYSTTQSNYVSTTQGILNSTTNSYNTAIQYQLTTSTNYINVYSTTQGNYVSTTQGILNSTSNSYSTSIQLVSTNSTIYVNAMSTSHGQYAYPYIAIKNSTLANWNSSIAGEQDRSTLFVNATSTAHGAYVSTAANLTSTTYTNWNSSIIGRNNLSTFNVNTISTAQGQFVSSALVRLNSTTVVLGNATQLISTNSTIYVNAMSTSHGQYSQSYITIRNSTLVNLNSSIVVEQNRSTLFVDATSTAHGVVVSTATNLTSTTYTNWNSSIIGRNTLSTFNANTISTAQGLFVSSAVGRFNSTTVVLGNATQLISTNSTIYVNAMSTAHGQYAQPFITAKNSTLFNWNSSINGRNNLSTVNVNTISTAQGQFVSSALVRLNSTAVVLGNATQLISTNSTIYVNAMSTSHGQYAYPFITIKNSTLFNWNSSIQGRDNLSTVNVNTISTAQGQFVSSALVRLNSTAVVLGNATQLISTNSTIYANEMSTSHGQYAYPFITIKNSTLTNWNSSIQGRNELSTINANTISTVQGRYVSSVSSVYYSSMIGLGNAILLTSTTSTTYHNITSTTHGMRVSTAANLTSTTYTTWMSSISAINTYSTTYINATSTAHGVYVSTATNLTSTTYTNWMSSITGRNTLSTVYYVNAISTAQGQYVQPFITASNNALANWNSSITGRNILSTVYYVNAISTAQGQYVQPFITAVSSTLTNWNSSITGRNTTSTMYVNATSTAHGIAVNNDPNNTWAATELIAKNSTYNSLILANTNASTTTSTYNTELANYNSTILNPIAINAGYIDWTLDWTNRLNVTDVTISSSSSYIVCGLSPDNKWTVISETHNGIRLYTQGGSYRLIRTIFRTLDPIAAKNVDIGVAFYVDGTRYYMNNAATGSDFTVYSMGNNQWRILVVNGYSTGTWNNYSASSTPVYGGTRVATAQTARDNAYAANISAINAVPTAQTNYNNALATWNAIWNLRDPTMFSSEDMAATYSNWQTAIGGVTDAEGIYNTAVADRNQAQIDKLSYNPPEMQTAFANYNAAVGGVQTAKNLYNGVISVDGVNGALTVLNQAEQDKLLQNTQEMQTALANWEQARDVGEPAAQALYTAAVNAFNNSTWAGPQLVARHAAYAALMDPANSVTATSAAYDAAVANYNSIVNYHKTVYGPWLDIYVGGERNVTNVTASSSQSYTIVGSRNGEYEVMKEVSNGNQIYTNFFACTYLRIIFQQINTIATKTDIGLTVYVNGAAFAIGGSGNVTGSYAGGSMQSGMAPLATKTGGSAGGFIYYSAYNGFSYDSYYSVYVKGGTGAGDLGTAQSQVSTTLANKNASIAAESTLQSNYTSALNAFNAVWLIREIVPTQFTSTAMTTSYDIWQDAINNGEPGAEALYNSARYAFDNLFGALEVVARDTAYANLQVYNTNLTNATNTYNSTLPAGGNRTIYGGYVEYYLGQSANPYYNVTAIAERYVTNVTVGTTYGQSISNSYVVCGKKNGIWEVLSEYDNSTLTYHNFPNISYSHVRVIFRHINSSAAYNAMNITIYVDGAVFNPFIRMLVDGNAGDYGMYSQDRTQYYSNNSTYYYPVVVTPDPTRFPLTYSYDMNIPTYSSANGNGTFKVMLNNAPTGYDPTTSNYTATDMSSAVHGGQTGNTAAYTTLQAATTAQQTAQTQYNTALAAWEAIWNQRHTSDLSSGGMATAYAAWQAAIAALNLNPGPYQGYARDSAAWSTVQDDKLLLDPSEMQTSRANWEYARDVGEPAAKAIYEDAFAVYNSIWGAVLLEARNVTNAANIASPSTATQAAYNTALAEWNALWLPRPLVLSEFTTLSAVSSAAMTTAYDNWEAAKAAWPAIKQNAVDAEIAWNSVQDDKVNILIVNTPAMITAKANWEQARDVGEPAAKAIYEAAVIVLNNIWGAVLLEARNVTNAAYVASATGTTLAARNAALAEWNALWLPRPLVPDDFTSLTAVSSAAMTTAYNNWQAAIAAWPAIKQNAIDAEIAWNSVQDDKVNILIVNTPAMIAAKANWEQARDVGEPAAKVIYDDAYAIFTPKWGAIELDARDRTGALAAWNALWLPRPLVPDDFTSLTTVSSAAMTTAYNNWQTAIAARPAVYQNWSDANDALNRVHTDKVNILIVNTPAMIAAKANWEQARDVGEPAAKALYDAAVLALSNTWGQSELIARDAAYAGFGYITSLISASAAADTDYTNKVTDYNNKVTAYNTALTIPTTFTGGYIDFDLGSNKYITDIQPMWTNQYVACGYNGSSWTVISEGAPQWSGNYTSPGTYSKVRIIVQKMYAGPSQMDNPMSFDMGFNVSSSAGFNTRILVNGAEFTTPTSVTGSHFTVTKSGNVYSFNAGANGWNNVYSGNGPSIGVWLNTPAISTSAIGGKVWAANVAAAQSQRDGAQTVMNNALTAKNQAKIAMDDGIASLTSTQAAYDAAVAVWNAVWYLRDPTMFSSASMTTTDNNWTIAKNGVIAARAIYDAVYNGKWGIAELEARDVTYAANVAAPSPATLAAYTAALAAWNALWLPRPLVLSEFTTLTNVASAAMTTAYDNWEAAKAAWPAIKQNTVDAQAAWDSVQTDKVNILIVNTPAMIAAKANWEQARDVGEPAAKALYDAAVLAFNNTWGAILLVARNTTYAAYVASPSNLSAYTAALADWNALWLPRPIVLSEFTAATMVSSANMTSTYNNWVQARDIGEPAAKAIYEAAFATYTNTWGAVLLDARDVANAAYVANNLPAKLDAYTAALAAWNALWLLRPLVPSQFTTLSAVSSASMTTAYNNWQAAIAARDTLYDGLYTAAVLAQNNVQIDKLLYNPAERQTSYAIWQAAILARDTLRDGLYADAVFAQDNVQIGKLAYNPAERQTSYAIWQAAIVARDTLYDGLYADAVFAQNNVLIGKLAYNPPERQTAYNDWQAAIAAIPVAKGIYDAAVDAYIASIETRRVAEINAEAFDQSLDDQDFERAELRRTTNGVGATVVAASFTYASDARLKKNVVPLNGALDKIDEFDGVYHDWKDEEQPDRAIGVIAQDIQKAYPELVSESSTGFLAVNYPKLTAVLLQSVKELKSMVMEVIERRKAAAQK